MYKCMECGHLFEDGEQKKWKEERGECHGITCYEEMSGCPLCGEAYEEVIACRICGGYGNMGDGKKYCNECKEDIFNRFKDLLNSNFATTEVEALKEFLEGEEL